MDNKKLNLLRDQAYSNAKLKGFHDKELSNEHYLMLVVTELAEAVQADRKNRRADVKSYQEYSESWKNEKSAFECFVKDTVEDELADTAIRILDFAGALGVSVNYKETVAGISRDTTFTEDVYKLVMYLYNFGFKPFKQTTSKFLLLLEMIADKYGINLWQHVEMKMKYNETRQKLHGSAY